MKPYSLLHLVAALTLAGVAIGAPAVAPRPNILLLVADDLGYGELGCQGNPEIPTPHIDSLARNGTRFTAGYVTASVCAPSRAALMTGRHQQRFGFENNPIGAQNLEPGVGLPLDERTLADHLKKAGYVTGAVGKWHLGGTEPFHPLRRGFDEFFGFLHEGHSFAPPGTRDIKSFLRTNTVPKGTKLVVGDTTWSTHTGGTEPPYDADNPLLRGTRPVKDPRYLTEAFAREASDFIGRHRAKPWFLYVPFNAVHSPMQATARDLARFPAIRDEHRRMFAAMLASLDDGVGTILDSLRRHGIGENTLIFFLSDNGGPTRELTSSNLPLSGGKGTLLEGGVRVPFLMQWPGRVPAGRTYRHSVSSLDIVPTALAAAGVKAPASPALDGVDLLPFLDEKSTGRPHDMLHWRMGNQLAIREGAWKLLRQRGSRDWQLFDLANDIGEQRDVAAQNHDIVTRLITAFAAWDTGTKTPGFPDIFTVPTGNERK